MDSVRRGVASRWTLARHEWVGSEHPDLGPNYRILCPDPAGPRPPRHQLLRGGLESRREAAGLRHLAARGARVECDHRLPAWGRTGARHLERARGREPGWRAPGRRWGRWPRLWVGGLRGHAVPAPLGTSRGRLERGLESRREAAGLRWWWPGAGRGRGALRVGRPQWGAPGRPAGAGECALCCRLASDRGSAAQWRGGWQTALVGPAERSVLARAGSTYGACAATPRQPQCERK